LRKTHKGFEKYAPDLIQRLSVEPFSFPHADALKVRAIPASGTPGAWPPLAVPPIHRPDGKLWQAGTLDHSVGGLVHGGHVVCSGVILLMEPYYAVAPGLAATVSYQ